MMKSSLRALFFVLVLSCVNIIVFAKEMPSGMKTLFSEYVYLHEANEYGKAFDKLHQVMVNYKDYIEPELAYRVEKMLINETLSGIMEFQENSSDPYIPTEWLKRAEKIPPPSKDRDNGRIYFDYSIILYQVAGKYLAEDDYVSSKLAFLKAETYFKESRYFEKTKSYPKEHREIRKWIEKLRRSLEDYIEKERIEIGTYVTNPGFEQKWIGRVVKNDGAKNAMTIRMTYSNTPAFRVGKDYSILKDEIKILKGVSLRAAIKGYK